MLLKWKHSIGIGFIVGSNILFQQFFPEHNVIFWGCFFVAYVGGVLPTVFFPPMFSFLYTAYCSRGIGILLKDLLHQRASLPHSNFRPGCRIIGSTTLPSASNASNFDAFVEHCRRNSSQQGDGGSDCEEMLCVVPIPMFADNYSYLCFSARNRAAAVVDPADAMTVLKMLEYVSKKCEMCFQLTDVLCTHKHWDHSGGNEELRILAEKGNVPYLANGLRVYGSDIDFPHGCTDFVPYKNNECIGVARGAMTARCVRSPGHTAGSFVFVLCDANPKGPLASERIALFTGDCIFCGGCGAMFEVHSIKNVIESHDAFHNDFLTSCNVHGSLLAPENVFVYVGHEYSERLYEELVNNATNAESFGRPCWSNKVLRSMSIELSRVRALRHLNQKGDVTMLPSCTVPSTLAVERGANPLLTLKREVLVNLSRKESRRRIGSTSISEIENAVYLSAERN